ncbi:MAG: glycosyltransferase [Cyclobacteriaceae bacterium]
MNLYLKNRFKLWLLKLKVKIFKIEVLFAEYGTVGAEICKFAKMTQTPIVVEFRGFDAFITKTIEFYKNEYQLLFDYAPLVIVKSELMKKQLVSLGCDGNKIKLIPSGYNEKVYHECLFNDESEDFIFIGRFKQKKGVEYIIKAFGIARDNLKKSTLHIIGDGRSAGSLVELVNELDLSEQIRFHGILGQDEIKSYMSKSLALLNHSILAENGDMEGLPNVILEANAVGLPVIATYHGGIPEFISNGVNGFLTREKDIESYSDFMLKLYNNRSLAKKMGQFGREKAKKFTSQAGLTKLNKCMNKLFLQQNSI